MCKRPAVSTMTMSWPRARRGLDRVVGDCGGIGPARRADEVRTCTLGPDLELLFGGRAKRVRRPHENRAVVLTQLLGELSDRGGLSGSVDADDEDDARTAVELERRRLAEQSRHFFGERVLELADLAPRLQPTDELGGGGNADIASDQRLLQPLPCLVVGGIERRGRELGGERAAALRERLAHACEDTGALRLVRRRRLVAEQLCPGPAHGGELTRRL